MDISSLVEMEKRLRENEGIMQQKHKEERKSIEEEIIAIHVKLAHLCSHRYTRDNYPYAPLYCSRCLLQKNEVLNLVHRYPPSEEVITDAAVGDI